MRSVPEALVSGRVLYGVPAADRTWRVMVSFLLRYHRRTGDLDVTEFLGEHAREEVLAARVDAKIARTNGDLLVPC